MKRTLSDMMYDELLQQFSGTFKVQPVRRPCQGDENCQCSAMYGYEDKKPLCCLYHRHEDMRNVLVHCCKFEGLCLAKASFGWLGGDMEFCSVHKVPGMLNLASKKCREPGCSVVPSFGYQRGDSTYCSRHKRPDMVVTSSKGCHVLGCTHFATYGHGTKAVYCSFHRSTDMVNVRKKHVKGAQSQTCLNCNVKATYGTLQLGRLYCRVHMDPQLHDRLVLCRLAECNQLAVVNKDKDVNVEPLCPQHGGQLCSQHGGHAAAETASMSKKAKFPASCMLLEMEQQVSLALEEWGQDRVPQGLVFTVKTE